MQEKQLQKLDQYIIQINTDGTLKHKIEAINILLTNQNVLNNNKIIKINNLTEINFPSELIDEATTDKQKETPNVISLNDVSLLNHKISAADQLNCDKIEILLIDLKKYIAGSAISWNTKISEFFKKSKFDDVILC